MAQAIADFAIPESAVFTDFDQCLERSSPDLATRDTPEPTPVAVDTLPQGKTNPIENVLGCIERNEPVSGPLAPDLCLIAQRIVDTAMLSAAQKRTLALIP